MSKPENSFIGGVHKYVGAYAEKMHNPYRGGTPDVWYSGTKRDLWVEYKFIVLPKRDSTLIIPDLSDLQLHWLITRQCEGRNVAVIVGCKEGGVFLDQTTTWSSGITAAVFRHNLHTRRELGRLLDDYVNA